MPRRSLQAPSALNPLKPRIPELTSIRIFAALWVVFFHSGLPNGFLYDCLTYDAPYYVHDFIRTGYLAIAIFFTLSGFVLAYNYDGIDTAEKRQRFWLGRVSRIYPVYLVGWVLMAPIEIDSILQLRSTGAVVRRTISNGLTSLFLMQAWIPHYALVWNTPCWALSCELFFYILYPFLLPIVQTWKERTLIVAIACTWVLSLIIPVVAILLSVGGFGLKYANEITRTSVLVSFIKFHPIMRLPEFFIGVLLGRMYLIKSKAAAAHPMKKKSKFYAPTRITIIILCCGFLASHIYQPLIYCGGLLTIVIGMHVYGLARDRSLIPGILRHKLFVVLGQASYAIFILHYPISLWFTNMDKDHLSAQYPLTVFLLYLIVTTGISCLTFRWVEEPCRRTLREKYSM